MSKQIVAAVERLNADPTVHGIIVQVSKFFITLHVHVLCFLAWVIVSFRLEDWELQSA